MKNKTVHNTLIVPLSILVFALTSSCLKPTPTDLLPVSTLLPPTLIKTPSNTPSPTITRVPPSPNPTYPPTLTLVSENILVSPLEGIPIEDLPDIITNKFSHPKNGSDGPHQGVDFSILEPASHLAIAGNPVRSILSGIVVSNMHDRFPYGNALLVETELECVDSFLKSGITLPSPEPILLDHSVLTCPVMETIIQAAFTENPANTNRSFYFLYAHLDEPSPIQVGEKISSGQILGAVGASGNALNPHLHLELRIGPSNARLPSMAHYDSSASLEEMSYYCLWRISNAFQLLDPMILFKDLP